MLIDELASVLGCVWPEVHGGGDDLVEACTEAEVLEFGEEVSRAITEWRRQP